MPKKKQALMKSQKSKGRKILNKRKICVVVASRANYARIKSVLYGIREHPLLRLQLIVAASALLERFGSVVEDIERDGFRIDAKVYIVLEGENPTTMAKSTGLSIIELATQFENLKPDIVLTVADRYETMSTAVAASYMNIPIAHTQGGEVTGSIDESVRHAVTKLSHIHFAATRKSSKRLLRLGEDPKAVYQTGCPSLDLIGEIDMSLKGVFQRYGGVGAPVDSKDPFIVVLQHPVTTEYASVGKQIRETIKAIAKIQMKTIWFWPNVDAGSDLISKEIRSFREQTQPDYIHFYRHFSAEDFLRLLSNACCLVGNSSSGIREGALLGIPVVNIGTRQNGRERARNVRDADYAYKDIVRAIRYQVKHGFYPSSSLYGDGQAGVRIADILSKHHTNIQKQLTF